LYGKADLQNAQRRAKDEKTQATDYAITKFARDLTSSLDILHLALRSVPEPLRTAPKDVASSEDPRKAISELYSGVELTSKSILDMLKMHGVTSFDPTGEKFNPLEHEAMYQAPVPGKEPGTVLECSKIGFKIKDRVLRAAQVGVVQETS
jgi:molecular chaperone GrpE